MAGGVLARLRTSTPSFWPTALLVVIGAAACVRFAGLGVKPVLRDEILGLFTVAGLTKADVAQRLAGREVTAAEVAALSCPRPESAPLAIVRRLVKDGEHPPLFFLTLWAWSAVAGCDVGALRGLTALLGVGLVLAIHGLGRRVLPSPGAALVAAALAAWMPVLVVIAQEARPAMLHALVAVIATSRLLDLLSRAREGPWAWGGYFVLTLAGMFTYGLYALVIAAHAGLALLSPRGLTMSREAKRGVLLASLAASSAYAGWLALKFAARGALYIGADYTWRAVPFAEAARLAALNLAGALDDRAAARFALAEGAPAAEAGFALGPEPLAILALILAAVVVAWRSGGPLLRFVLAAFLLPGVLYLAKDAALGGSAAAVARYQITTYAGLCLAAAQSLSTFEAAGIRPHAPATRRWFAMALLAALLALQASSLHDSLQAEYWWSNPIERDLGRTAAIIAAHPSAIVLVPDDRKKMAEIVQLARFLPPLTRMRATSGTDRCAAIAASGGPVLIYGLDAKPAAEPACPGIGQRQLRPGDHSLHLAEPGAPSTWTRVASGFGVQPQ